MSEAQARPAFYALAPGGWRDYVTLLHPPYTAWHLSYVVIGACLAPHLYSGRLAATAAAFFLALGISAHALDELQGRPLATQIPEGVLVALSIVPLAAAVAIGIAGAIAFNLWLLAFVGVGLALVPVYNLELFGGAIHNGAGFALAWGAFPLLTGYAAQTGGSLAAGPLLAAAGAVALSAAQRSLSTPARTIRRRSAHVEGTMTMAAGPAVTIDQAFLLAPLEAALRALTWATVLLASALAVTRLC